MPKMVPLTSLLAFFLPLPLRAEDDTSTEVAYRRRRAIDALSLSPHLQRDLGLADREDLVDDPRWQQCPKRKR